MKAVDEWVLFLQKNPQYYVLTKSKLYIAILKRLKKNAKTISQLRMDFPTVAPSDLDLIINSLLELNLLTKIETAKEVFYKLSKEGLQLLKEYSKARERFKVE